MWVSVEHAHSKRVCILAKDWRIHPPRDPSPPSEEQDDTTDFVEFVQICYQLFLASMEDDAIQTWKEEFKCPAGECPELSP
jgi:hypothetical protein